MYPSLAAGGGEVGEECDVAAVASAATPPLEAEYFGNKNNFLAL